jgi:hypothetical protein
MSVKVGKACTCLTERRKTKKEEREAISKAHVCWGGGGEEPVTTTEKSVFFFACLTLFLDSNIIQSKEKYYSIALGLHTPQIIRTKSEKVRYIYVMYRFLKIYYQPDPHNDKFCQMP